MSAPAIRAEGLGKRYELGRRIEPNRTLGDTLAATADRAWQAAACVLGGARSAREDRAFWALRDVSFEVAHGEAVGIIGGNGAGKSTLLKLLSRITAPTTGRAEIRGRVGSLLEVGTGFHPDLTGRENVFLNGAILGMRRGEIARKFDDIVAFAEVERFIDTPVKRYSSGMYLRLAFAVAAYLEPEVLLVDEVLAVGDAAFQEKCLGKMGDVAREGRTVIFVSHNLVAVQALCARAVLLQRGSVAFSGSSADAVAAYHAARRVGAASDVLGQVALTTRENEHTPGRLFLRHVAVTDAGGGGSTAVSVGEPLRVEVEIAGLAEIPAGVVGVKFTSLTGHTLLYFNTAMRAPRSTHPRAPCERVIFHIDRMPLTPGYYWIDLSLFTESGGRLDYVQHAVRLEVIAADVFRSGYAVTEGVVYLDSQWEIVPATSNGTGDAVVG